MSRKSAVPSAAHEIPIAYRLSGAYLTDILRIAVGFCLPHFLTGRSRCVWKWTRGGRIAAIKDVGEQISADGDHGLSEGDPTPWLTTFVPIF
jgi:hypothetical protein